MHNTITPQTGAAFSHPKYQYRFMALDRADRQARPCQIIIEATSEREARSCLRTPFYLFSARIRITEGVYQVLAHLHSSTGEGRSFLLPDLFADHQQAERLASAAAFNFSFPGHTGKVTCEVVEMRNA